MKEMAKSRWLLAAAGLALALALPASALAGAPPVPKSSPYSMDLYGEIAGALPGDVVTVRDLQGTLCGVFTVVREGRYGFLHVYGDDKATATDEGALTGEPLEVLLNGERLTPLTEPVRWQVDGRMRVDFRR